MTEKYGRVKDIKLWGATDIDGYIVQSLSGAPDVPSLMLSKYLGRDVRLVYKGPRPRPCERTFDFPKLDATAVYQDGYPLLLASVESLMDVREKVREFVGKGTCGTERERWKDGEVEMERCVRCDEINLETMQR